MFELCHNLYVGNDHDCTVFDGAIVHACQSCFVRGVNGAVGNKTFYENNDDLYLNLLDISSLSYDYASPMIKRSIDFIDRKIKDKKVLVHCNFGMSRSPSICLLYMAKKGYINNSSFKEASKDFHKIYNYFSAGLGMHRYFDRYWNDIMQF